MPNDVSNLSTLSNTEASQLIGQTVARVDTSEFGLILTFSSGAVLEVRGHTYNDSALDVDFTNAV